MVQKKLILRSISFKNVKRSFAKLAAPAKLRLGLLLTY